MIWRVKERDEWMCCPQNETLRQYVPVIPVHRRLGQEDCHLGVSSMTLPQKRREQRKKIKTGKGRGEEQEGREITMEVFYCYLRRSIVRKFLKSL